MSCTVMVMTPPDVPLPPIPPVTPPLPVAPGAPCPAFEPHEQPLSAADGPRAAWAGLKTPAVAGTSVQSWPSVPFLSIVDGNVPTVDPASSTIDWHVIAQLTDTTSWPP